MRWPTSLALTLTTLTLTSVASTSVCPERCSCGVGDEREYWCRLEAANVTVTGRVRDYVNVDCEGGALSCSDFPLLPLAGNATLPSLSIRDCSLPEPLACVAGRLGATAVDVLMLRNVLTPLEGRHVEGLGSGVVIMFNAAAQKSIPSSALSSLPSLHHFRLCGGDVTLSPLSFPNPPPLTYLELATDKIASLPAGTFEGLGALKTLNMWGNNVSYVSEDAFKGLSNLEELYISTSRVRGLPSGLLSHTPSLKKVKITRNMITTVPDGLFRGLTHLREVTISNDVPLTLEPHTFSNLSLTSLTLDQASLSHLPPTFLQNTTTLVNFTITHNRLGDLPLMFEGLVGLERVDLSFNNIESVPVGLFVGLRRLREVKMDGNRIQELPDQLFAGLRRLEYLSISSNRLHSIPPTSLPPSLLYLSLTHNSLSLAPPPSQYYNLEQYSPFNNLVKLKILKLARNEVATIFDDWKNVLLDLVELDLKWNKFGELNYVDVQFLSSQIVVDLRYNNITTLMLAQGYDIYDKTGDRTGIDKTGVDKTGDDKFTKASILLDDNPFNCDCRLYEVAKRLRGAKPMTVEPQLVLNETYCASPKDLRGLKLAKVPLKDFVCDIECPCQCEIRPYTDSLNLECFNDSKILDPTEYGLSHTVLKLRQIPTNITLLPDYVTVLNLSNIGLKTVPKSVPKSLEILDLSNNRLEEIPTELLHQNLSLKLSGNRFICDCGVVHQIAIMNKFSSKILDWQRVRCKDGSLMWRIEVQKLCLVQRAAVLGGVLAAFGILLAALAVIIHRYSVEIRIFLTNRGLLCCFVDEYDATKKYDVFVSFAHHDEAFVLEKLLPKLELNYKVCVHHRDWRVGDLIPAQIARSVEESRRTLIILSKNFLASTWGMLEFRAAHVQAAREKKVRVIVLLLEDLTDVEVDSELRAYLTTNTYIKWGDQWFWEKLQYALPKRTRAKDVRREERAKQAADIMAKGGLQVTLTADGKLVNNAFNKSVI